MPAFLPTATESQQTISVTAQLACARRSNALYIGSKGCSACSYAATAIQEMGVVKIGPWGSEGESEWDWDIPATPQRMENITVCSSLAVVDAISFRYRDENNVLHNVGPWGGNGGDPDVIRLEPGEFITEVSGAFGYIGTQPGDVVTTLTFITNRTKHGPFGNPEPEGTPFRVPVHNGGSIVALFGRAGDYLEAMGIYVRA